MDHKWDKDKELVHTMRLALEGKVDDVAALVRRRASTLIKSRPDLESSLRAVLSLASASPVRFASDMPLPVDADSRLQLLRREEAPAIVGMPKWPDDVQDELNDIVQERIKVTALLDAGLVPSRTLLLVGPPGTGKTLAARWLALKTGFPLLTLDLAAVMSSFLGRTGNNVRSVLDYARKSPSVLLLDEFDTIAKRRDDAADVGELKRLVNVLLQSVDDWPSECLLIAATNHPDLLDSAVWRRFDRVIRFSPPGAGDREIVIKNLLSGISQQSRLDPKILADVLAGKTYADITRILNGAKRSSIVKSTDLDFAILDEMKRLIKEMPLEARIALAKQLELKGLSQRDVAVYSGLSRETLRKHLSSKNRVSSRRKK